MQVTSVGNHKEEGFETTYLRGQLSIKANSEKSAQQALHFWKIAEKSGCMGDFLGISTPRFPLRPLLWKGGELPPDWEQHLLGWGFNALITDQSVQSELIQVFSRSKGTFYESALTPELHRTQTTGERILQEIKQKEGGDLLLFCLPAWLEPDWLWTISEDVGPKTVLVFDAEQDPLWKSLRQEIHPTKTALMPLLKDPYQINILSRCTRHRFLGAVVPLSSWPAAKSEVEGALWVAGQSQWWGISPELLVETWQKKNCLGYSLQ